MACGCFTTAPVSPSGKLCFLPGPGPGSGKIQKTEAGFIIFFNTGAEDWSGLTKITYTGAESGFVEKYRDLTEAGAGTGVPVECYLSYFTKLRIYSDEERTGHPRTTSAIDYSMMKFWFVGWLATF